MTRFARANNIHKKQPDNATPWNELSSSDQAGSSGNEPSTSSVPAKRKQRDDDDNLSGKKAGGNKNKRMKPSREPRSKNVDSNGWNEHRMKNRMKNSDGTQPAATTGDAGDDGEGPANRLARLERPDVARNRHLTFGGNFGRTFEDEPIRGNAKVCFNCRQTGHRLADCPTAQNRDRGRMCFKCGSVEHDIKRCPVTTDEMPFATCFVCKCVGHLSRNCPENAKGVYIRGGECRGCGSKAHLFSQCPTIKKAKEAETTTVFADRVSSFAGSVDLESTGPKKQMPAKSQHKVVKF